MVRTTTLRQRKYFDEVYFERLIYNKRAEEILEEKRKRRKIIVNSMFLSVAVVMVLYFAINLLMIFTNRLSLIYQQSNITKLEARLEERKKINMLIEDEINHMVDEEYVRKVAIMKLSMYVPSEKDIIYFDKSNNSYVRQYDNVR